MANGELRVIQITEVNPAQNFIVGNDPYNSTLQVTWHFHDAVVVVPQVGESWLIERYGNDWFLFKRSEPQAVLTDVNDLKPGDRRLEASGALYLTGETVVINGVSITAAQLRALLALL